MEWQLFFKTYCMLYAITFVPLIYVWIFLRLCVCVCSTRQCKQIFTNAFYTMTLIGIVMHNVTRLWMYWNKMRKNREKCFFHIIFSSLWTISIYTPRKWHEKKNNAESYTISPYLWKLILHLKWIPSKRQICSSGRYHLV